MSTLPADRITRDVILDLLPAVRGGVASADSKRLVEEYLALDPAFAAKAAVLPAPSAGMELEALKRTRRHVHAASWAMAMGIFFTMLPFAFIVDGAGAMRFVFAEMPVMQAVLLAFGAVSWVAYFMHRKKMGA